FLTSVAYAVNPSLYANAGYDPFTDFLPVILAPSTPNLITVNPAVPAKNLQELVALARAKPGSLNYASSGPGSMPHLAGELLKQRTGAQLDDVPYKGGGQAVIDVLGGQIPLVFTAIATAQQYVRGGRLVALGVPGAKRSAALPDVPTFAEAAQVPDFEVVSWHMLLAPSGTPKEIVARLHTEMNRIMAAPDMQQKINAIGLLPVGAPSLEAIQKFVASEREKWGTLVQKLGLAGSQ
ncbi:MAG: tripartite tricarboxylate transporter substrate-binding protein, partial [Burkholderiales bacterium]